MKKQTTTTTYTTYSRPLFTPCLPEAFISVRNNRVKHYIHEGENRIYLEDGTEFELEFYNNSDDYVKAVITINGVKQASALVLRPHQRFYLDRFMDEQKKFKFNTFLTGNDDIEKLKEIIEKNGRIKIEFYQESKPFIPYTYTTNAWYNGNTGNFPLDNSLTYRGGVSDTREMNDGNVSNYSAKLKSCGVNALCNMRSEPEEIETGRVEAGAKSNQDFVSTDKQFGYWPVATFEYHIMPKSHKPKEVKMKKQKDVIVADDVRTYCPGCGRRVKKGWQFCAGCGRKF